MMKKINTSYVSPLDEFMAEFNRQHPEKSASQEKEIKKYNRISRLRDDETAQDPVAHPRGLWDE